MCGNSTSELPLDAGLLFRDRWTQPPPKDPIFSHPFLLLAFDCFQSGSVYKGLGDSVMYRDVRWTESRQVPDIQSQLEPFV